MDSQVNASQCKFAKPELAYVQYLWWVAKRIHKLARKSQKVVNFTHIIG